MNVEKLLIEAKGDANNKETIAFRINAEVKDELFEVCSERNLSVGRLMRALIADFLEEVRADA